MHPKHCPTSSPKVQHTLLDQTANVQNTELKKVAASGTLKTGKCFSLAKEQPREK